MKLKLNDLVDATIYARVCPYDHYLDEKVFNVALFVDGKEHIIKGVSGDIDGLQHVFPKYFDYLRCEQCQSCVEGESCNWAHNPSAANVAEFIIIYPLLEMLKSYSLFKKLGVKIDCEIDIEKSNGREYVLNAEGDKIVGESFIPTKRIKSKEQK